MWVGNVRIGASSVKVARAASEIRNLERPRSKMKTKTKSWHSAEFGTFSGDSTKPFIGTTFSRQGGERKRGDKCSHFLLWCKQSFVSVTRGNLQSDSDVMVNWPITGRDLPLIVMHCFVTLPQLPSVQCRSMRGVLDDNDFALLREETARRRRFEVLT